MGDRARCARPRSHSDAEIGILKRKDVVHAVAGHGHGRLAQVKRVDHCLLLRWRDSSEHRRGRENLPEGHRILGERARIDRPIRPGHPREGRDRAHGGGVVAGDHLHAHPLLEEVADGLSGVGAQSLIDEDEGYGGEQAHPGIGARRLGAGADDQDPGAVGGLLISLQANGVAVRNEHLGCPDDPGTMTLEGSR